MKLKLINWYTKIIIKFLLSFRNFFNDEIITIYYKGINSSIHFNYINEHTMYEFNILKYWANKFNIHVIYFTDDDLNKDKFINNELKTVSLEIAEENWNYWLKYLLIK